MRSAGAAVVSGNGALVGLVVSGGCRIRRVNVVVFSSPLVFVVVVLFLFVVVVSERFAVLVALLRVRVLVSIV